MLRRVPDIAVSTMTISAAGAIVWVVLVDAGARPGWPWRAREVRPPTGYLRGDKIDELPGVDFRVADRTLLVVFTSRGQFCIEGVPYNQRLVSTPDKDGAKVRIVAVGFEQDQGARRQSARRSL
jgi:hypothetical protein